MLPIDHHIWVNASAGTGKTYTLTQRVLQLLLSGTPASTILCLTYTNAAAAEMKSRILEQLGQWVIADEALLETQLQRIKHHISEEDKNRARGLFFTISENPDSLSIQTIHGFCQSILRRFPMEAGISPYFTVIDEEQSASLVEESLQELLYKIHCGELPELTPHIHAITQQITDMSLRNIITSAMKNAGRWRVWLHQPGGLPRCNAILQECFGLLEADIAPPANFPLDSSRRQRIQHIADALASSTSAQLKTIAEQAQTLLHLPSIHLQDMQEYRASWLTKKLTVKDPVTKLIEKNTPLSEPLAQEAELIMQEALRLAQLQRFKLTQHIYQLIAALWDIYYQKSEQNGYVDYHELLSRTKRFLTEDEHALGWVMYKLDGGIDHLLVDEAQDTNPLQWDIIKVLTREYFSGVGREKQARSLFIVGDEKQSIFSFQDADVHYYRQMKRWLIEKCREAMQPFLEHTLSLSYRSAPAIIEGVNRALPALGFQSPHSTIRMQAEGQLVIWPLVDESGEAERPASAHGQLAASIADEIKHWLEEGRVIESTGKPINPEDVLILMRRRSDISTNLASELRKRNIPVQGVEKLILKDNLAVQDMLALFSWCLLPQDDYQLACILRSPIANISEDALYQLSSERLHTEGMSLWQSLQQHSQQHHLQEVVSLLSNCLDSIHQSSIHGMLITLLYQHGLAQAYRRRMGHDAIIALHALLEKAQLFEHTNPRQYQLFIETIQAQEHEFVSKESPGNCVRIMTVHGAKGLEAPIVILADAASSITAPNGFCWLDMDEQRIPLWLPQKHEQGEALRRHIHTTTTRQLEENYRLCYVAITRPRDELYITGIQPTSSDNDAANWHQLLSSQWAKYAKNLPFHAAKNPKQLLDETPQHT